MTSAAWFLAGFVCGILALMVYAAIRQIEDNNFIHKPKR